MEIDKNNYEAYLLDLWEGNLSEEKKVMLSQFLEEHPALNEDNALELLSSISITKSDNPFDKTAINFEDINSKNYEYFFIAYAEGDLSKEEMIAVDKFLKENPLLHLKFAQFNKAKLPLETIHYPNKEKLIFDKTRIISIQTKRWIIGLAAASVALLFWTGFPFEDTAYKYTMSQNKKLKIEKYNAHSLNIDKINQSINLENQIAKQMSTSNSKTDNKSNQKIIKNIELNKQETKNIGSEIKFKNPFVRNNTELVAVTKLEAKEISDVIASIIPLGKYTEESDITPSVKNKKEIPSLIDLTANYLQRKNILTEERKPDIKGIINNTLSNEKPIITIEEKQNVKTTVFQLGKFKIERKTRK